MDYCGFLGYFSTNNCYYSCEDDTIELERYEDVPIVLPGIEAWCKERDETIYKKEVLDGVKSAIDWEN